MKVEDYKGLVFESIVCGIPCLIGYNWAKGYPQTATDPGEPDGPEDVTIFDRKGYEADWLWEKAGDQGVDLGELCAEDYRAREW